MSERRVYFAQLLCPERHLIMAMAEKFDTAEEAEVLRQELAERFEDLVAKKVCRPTCALCLSNDFHVEPERTRFRSIPGGKPVLGLEWEDRQRLTQMFWKAHRN